MINLVIGASILSLVIGFLLGMFVTRDKDSWAHKPDGVNKKIDSILDKWDKEEAEEDRNNRRKELFDKITKGNKEK